ncbi:MAG: DNA-directed polymerase subunit beta [Proteobacteria bacterium]|nr:DNA-directed polymerase subunit beta [Pseudomonadota bacterium]
MQSDVDAVSTAIINILVVVDTANVKATLPAPSQDPAAPTPVDQENLFILGSGARGNIAGQCSANLQFSANAGDYVSISGTSIYHNSDDAVVVYSLEYTAGEMAFNAFSPSFLTRSYAVTPDPEVETGIPPGHTSIDFSSLESRTKGHGMEKLSICFGLYTLAKDGETQELFGYYCSRPSLTVSVPLLAG